ncbi:hypothetical protein TNCV_2518441 [Trichonephila clavipes]|nr:hypothetical protein TNCV_2518441 [Trichonephila clavipes]
MILCVAEFGKIEEGRKITDVAREFRSQRCFTAVEVILNCSRRHGDILRRLQKTDISSYHQKEQAHHSSAGGKSASASGKQISRKLLPDV